jgi:adenosylcobinamide-GDP ribazoletransferase
VYEPGALRRAADGLAAAVVFLTVAPLPLRGASGSRWASAWFPVVGALVGAVAGGVRYGFDDLLGSVPATVLATIALMVVTGALHQDGLADCADGIGARGDRARRLAVMREPQVGVFGVLAVLLWLLLLVSAVASLDRDDALRVLVLASALGRWGALFHAVTTAPARSDGLGADFKVARTQLVLASAAATAAAFALEAPARAVTALAAAALVALAVSAWSRQAIGGRTGDTLGASVALVEVIVCLVVLGFV